ncbi:MAG: carbohydrate kinase family protein [Candidatus Bathyarchaeia archaeon]
MMYDLVTVGHIVIDHIVSKGVRHKPTLGGPPTYASLAARRLGANVSVVSKVGADFPDDFVVWLGRMGVDLTGLRRDPNSPTTRYLLKYDDGERSLTLINRCSAILPEDVPKIRSKGIHLGPCAGELTKETVRVLTEAAELVSLDPQGFIRGSNSQGRIRLRRWLDKEVLGRVDVYRSSEEELLTSTGSRDVWKAAGEVRNMGPRVVIAQRGTLGSLMLIGKAKFSIPACKPRRVVDPTGAGDAFIGAFMTEYLRGEDPVWCAAVGSSVASFVVEGIGPSSFGSREEIRERAVAAHSEIKKL